MIEPCPCRSSPATRHPAAARLRRCVRCPDFEPRKRIQAGLKRKLQGGSEEDEDAEPSQLARASGAPAAAPAAAASVAPTHCCRHCKYTTAKLTKNRKIMAHISVPRVKDAGADGWRRCPGDEPAAPPFSLFEGHLKALSQDALLSALSDAWGKDGDMRVALATAVSVSHEAPSQSDD